MSRSNFLDYSKKKKITYSKVSNDDSKPTTPNSQINNSSNSGGLVFGEAFEQTIENMTNMGFQKSDVIRALHAAYHNPDRALDFLFNVILLFLIIYIYTYNN